jgi:hypothetical protein
MYQAAWNMPLTEHFSPSVDKKKQEIATAFLTYVQPYFHVDIRDYLILFFSEKFFRKFGCRENLSITKIICKLR